MVSMRVAHDKQMAALLNSIKIWIETESGPIHLYGDGFEIVLRGATRSTPAMECNVSFGGSLGPLLRLKKSIPLTVERPFVLIWENTEEYSQGNSLGQAMDDFGISVRQLWKKVHDGSPLGPELLRIRSLLEEYIEPQPGPAAPPATQEKK